MGQVRDLAVDDGEGVCVETCDELDVGVVGASGGGDGTIGPDGEGGERLEGECRVGGWARGDEAGSDRVNLVEVERGVLGAGPSGSMVDRRAQPSLVTSLGSEDRAGDGHVRGLGDGGCGTEVGRDTDVLDRGGEAHEGDRVNDRGERVGAWLGGSVAKGAGEESDVLGLVLGDVGDTIADPVGITGLHEIGLGELAKLGGVSGDPL